ncbi:hypothetical protein SCE1572_47245 [Sorangium cellulosum So0157-2]|uniref:Serine protease n=1 Tax=Sorangium cellulosum So0157-2 TaxID=1254432 RepID=S4Y961_SORCE|nr:hypothetical protein SCE1572_47245 [Sorangium cellulosum So0157-2]
MLRALPPRPVLDTAITVDAAALRSAERSARLPIAVQSPALQRAPAARAALAALLEHGAALLRSRGAAIDAAPLTDRDRDALVALYIVYGRPAVPVRNDQLQRIPVGWELLDGWRDPIQGALPSLGRIELRAPDGRRAPIGTGFLVAPELVMTARHVADDLRPEGAPPPRPGERIDPAVGAQIDWRAEADNPDAFARFRIVELTWAHPEEDVALLRLSREGAEPAHARMPLPLPLCSAAPAQLDGALVFTGGYPVGGGEGALSWQRLQDIFPGVLGTKRLQPGKLLAPAWSAHRLQHDCSTLGGSSGAPLFLLERHRPLVIGVHVAGAPFTANLAAPTWRMRDALPRELLHTGAPGHGGIGFAPDPLGAGGA